MALKKKILLLLTPTQNYFNYIQLLTLENYVGTASWEKE